MGKARVEPKGCDDERVDKLDTGYGWVVVGGSFLGHVAVLGLQYTFGVTFAALIEHFEASREAVAWVGSLTIGLQSGLGFLSGWLVSRLGERAVICLGGGLAGAALLLASFATQLWQLYLTYGVMLGVACSCLWPPCILVVQRWFSRRRALASGAASSGSGVGTMVLGPVVAALIDGYGWQTTFRILAVFIVLLAGVVAALLRPPRGADMMQRRTSWPYLWAGDQQQPLLRSNPLRLLMLSTMISGLGFFVVPVHLVQHAKDLGLTEGQRSSLVSCIGIGLLSGRVPIGWLADRCALRVRAFAIVTALLGITNGLAAVLRPFWALVGIAWLYGLCTGSYVALTPTVVKEFMPIEALPQAAGLVYTTWGLTMMFGPPAAGLIYKLGSPPSYTPAFLAAGACLLVGAALALALEVLLAYRRRSQGDKLDAASSLEAGASVDSAALGLGGSAPLDDGGATSGGGAKSGVAGDSKEALPKGVAPPAAVAAS